MNRFATARVLFEEFPTLAQAAKVEPTDEDPVGFVKSLATVGKLREAVAVCAYLMPKREAVWWTCHCLRMRPEFAPADDPALLAAEAWAREPTEEIRDIAARWGKAGDQSAPSTWAACAAGFTSGNMTGNPDAVVRPPAYMTPECARVALLFGEGKLSLEEAKVFLKACVDTATRYFDKARAG